MVRGTIEGGFMLKVPCFRPSFRVERVAPDQVFLMSERDRFFLKGALYYTLAPLLTGTHSSDAIVAALPQETPLNLYYALMQLEQKGYLVEAQPAEIQPAKTAAPPTTAPTKAATPSDSPKPAAIKLFVSLNASASVKAGLHRLALQLEQALSQSTETASPETTSPATDSSPTASSKTDSPPIAIVLTDDYLHPGLADYNATALNTGQSWLLAKPLGEEMWLGPCFVPQQTACWECLAQRLRGNRPMEQWLDSLGERECIQQAQPATDEDSLAIAQQQILDILHGNRYDSLQKQLITRVVSPGGGDRVRSDGDGTVQPQEQLHPLTPRPQCIACGDGKRLRSPQVLTALPEPIQLQSCPKTFTADGGHRSQTPEATLVQLAAQVSPISGVVRELRAVAVDGSTVDEAVLDPGEPELEQSASDDQTLARALLQTYITAHDSGEVARDLEALKLNLQGRSAGKGKTRTQAKVSGICEAIERYSGIFQGDEPRRRGSYDGLRDQGVTVIHPNEVMRFSSAQYINRDDWNASQSDMRHYVPQPFDPNAEIEWSPLWSLTEQRFKYLPTAQCYYGYATPFCKANSNGCAAGNTREEAILQGFLELVERDAVAIWWGNQAQRPGIELESFADPYFMALQDHYFEAYGRTLYLLDLTHDLGIPVVVAVSHLIDADTAADGRPDQKILCGFGAHFEGEIAISRALTEVNQLLTGSIDPTNRTGSSPAGTPARPPRSQPPVAPRLLSERLATPYDLDTYQIYLSLVDQPHLMANPMLTPITAETLPAVRRSDLLEDVQACMDIVQKAGMEMLVLDQTRPDIGLPVVRVVVPGMRHFWRRLAPGRLYDVPIEQQWFLNPRWEERQNPLPFPF